jgi:hypothetical protein
MKRKTNPPVPSTKACMLAFGLLSLTTYAQSSANNDTVIAAKGYHKVMARKNAEDTLWKSYTAKTIDKLPGFTYSKDPSTNIYGSWKVSRSKGTGFFRTEKKGDRWWIIDPEGYPFIHKGVAVFTPGTSDNQKKAFSAKFQTGKNWAAKESSFLKQHGFNGAGAWSDVDVMREEKDPLVYTVIVRPMGAYKDQHIKK